MKLVDYSVGEFIKTLASDSAAPGGGSASALAGAVGSALICMVANLTVNKEAYRDKEPIVREILKECNNLAEEFLRLIDLDTEAFNEVSAVFLMSKSTDEEKANRKKAMEKALKNATIIPFSIMERGAAGLDRVAAAINNTNPSALSDLGVAVHCLMAAIQGGWLNVLINIGSIKDEDFAAEYREKGRQLMTKCALQAASLQKSIEEAL